jgi:hypothetical protein
VLKPKSFLSRRSAGLAAAAAILSLAVSACGSSSSASSGQSGSSGGGIQSALSSKTVQACLKKQGVTLPNRGQGRPPGGATGQGGPPPNGGQPPSAATGGQGPGRNSAQFQKLQKALKACGVTLPQGGPQGGQAPSGTTGTSTNNS